jgi:hypothetical protein
VTAAGIVWLVLVLAGLLAILESLAWHRSAGRAGDYAIRSDYRRQALAFAAAAIVLFATSTVVAALGDLS